MLESEDYMTYRAYATGEKTLKPKSIKKKSDSESSPKTKLTQASKGKRIKTLAKGDEPVKMKQSAIQLKGAGDKLEVPDVPEYKSDSEEESWTFSQGEVNEENDEHDTEDDNDEHDSANDNDDEDDDQENVNDQEEEDEEEKTNDDDECLLIRSYNQTSSEKKLKPRMILKQIDSNIKAIIKDQVKAQVPKILPKVKNSQTPDRGWHKTKIIDDRPPQSWMTQLAQASGTHSSFNEFFATPIEFSAFIMNRLKIHNLTQDVLIDPTYDLIKGTHKSVVELQYHLEEVFKATNDQLDWHNPEGRPYPHDLSKPLPLIQNHAYWGTYHRGPKHQKFYGYSTNMETSKDVYSRHKIIAVTSLKIMEFFGYQHLEEITVRRQDDQLYKFQKGDFKRLRRQDIKDMLLLLVQGKLTNLNLDERFALNVALRMYTRRIVIQECVEDLQLAVESYQKKINLSKPDSYHLDLIKMTPYIAYPDIQGIVYQDDMNRNCLMHTDELYKFSDDTLNHVCIALNDIATRIQMEYLPKRKWSKQDKQRARVMINAIDKKLRDRRLMRSLENFVAGRPYRGDLRLLQRTI
uniref:Uncharacterized protein n=1 Tax=Tanacetum cinerariifolium TaxID=118510 RepID=A0A6L2NII9_TANCI|nr:hypothetical protein [Tanacetum cinerariifolium]